jgi:hypothetical protein
MAFKVQKGAIVRPLGFPTELHKAKSSENATQLPGKFLVYNYTNKEFELPAIGALTAQSDYFGVIVNSNLNDIAGKRELIIGNGTEVLCQVVAQTAIVPGREVILSEVVAGDVDTADVAGGDNGTRKVVGRFICKATEFWKDGINNTFSNAAQNDIIIIRLYAPTGGTVVPT